MIKDKNFGEKEVFLSLADVNLNLFEQNSKNEVFLNNLEKKCYRMSASVAL